MHIFTRTLVLYLLGSFIFLSAIAYADQSKENPRYKVAIEQAKKATKEGRHKDAAEAMRRAISISPNPKLYYDIAQRYEKAKDSKNALKFYQRFIDEVPSDARVTAASQRVQALIAQLKDQYEEVMITTQPSGAYIYVNNRANGAQGRTPHRMKLLPGEYTIIAELDGYVTTEQRLTLQAGAASQVAITLYNESEVAPVKFLINRSGAQLYVDRRLKGKSPFMDPLLIRKGIHEIKVIKPGYVAWKKRVKVIAQQPMTIDIELKEAGRQQLAQLNTKRGGGSIGPWITLGTGVVLIGGSAYTGISAQRLYGQLDELRNKEQLISQNDINVGNSLVLVTNLLIGLGAASLTSGGVWLFMDSSDSSPKMRGDLIGEDSSSRFTQTQLEGGAP